MRAVIMMWIDGQEYPYGTYAFDTAEEKNRVNELAIKVGQERGCYTYVKQVEG